MFIQERESTLVAPSISLTVNGNRPFMEPTHHKTEPRKIVIGNPIETQAHPPC